MNSILDQLAATRELWKSFRPKTAADVFALQLAAKLGESSAVSHYGQLTQRYSLEQLAWAYKHAATDQNTIDLPARFHQVLVQSPPDIRSPKPITLLSLSIKRRIIDAAVFRGHSLEYTQSRQLPSATDKAVLSAVKFLVWLTRQFNFQSAAVEGSTSSGLRKEIFRAMLTVLRQQNLPIWEVAKSELLSSFGYPVPKSRRELSAVITSIWPILGSDNDRDALDAVALGLYVQVARYFLI